LTRLLAIYAILVNLSPLSARLSARGAALDITADRSTMIALKG
jgi:hypothetical protein